MASQDIRTLLDGIKPVPSANRSLVSAVPRNVRCSKCHKYGRTDSDKQCPMNNGNNTKIVESKPKPKWIPKESNLSKKIDEDNTSKNSSESATTNFIIRWNEELWANSFGQPIPEEILSQCLPGYCKLCGVFLKSNDAKSLESSGKLHYLGEIHKTRVEIELEKRTKPHEEKINHSNYSENHRFSGTLYGKLNTSLEKIGNWYLVIWLRGKS